MLAAVERIEIGDHVMFANGCFVGDADHRYDDPDTPITWQGFEPRGPVRIGDNVWFGVNCVVTGGVEIGDRAVIGANSVVTETIPPGRDRRRRAGEGDPRDRVQAPLGVGWRRAPRTSPLALIACCVGVAACGDDEEEAPSDSATTDLTTDHQRANPAAAGGTEAPRRRAVNRGDSRARRFPSWSTLVLTSSRPELTSAGRPNVTEAFLRTGYGGAAGCDQAIRRGRGNRRVGRGRGHGGVGGRRDGRRGRERWASTTARRSSLRWSKSTAALERRLASRSTCPPAPSALADHLDDDGPLARAVVEVDQDELLPGAERRAGRRPPGRPREEPISEARWWACELVSWLSRLCS